MRVLRSALKALALGLHRGAERLGLHILPVHYYSPIPVRHELARTREVWARPSDLPGLAWDLERQLDSLRRVVAASADERDGFEAFERATRDDFGPGFGPIEARVLYSVVRTARSRHVVEVGAGVSTAVILSALKRNGSGVITCIDPHPHSALRHLPVTLVQAPVQAVPLETFTVLQENDVLFIDSTHAVRVGGDVNYIVLEILPRLSSGVLVHFHDIFLPYDYSPSFLESLWSWTETSLVRAYLVGNESVRVLFCLSALHHARAAALASIIPDYRPRMMRDGLNSTPEETNTHFPASLWLQIGGERRATEGHRGS